jgi:type I restriction enzyme S subunit
MRPKPYPRYKPSGVEWLGDVPEHWEVKRLKWSIMGCINGVWGDEPNGVDDLICIRVADFDRDNYVVIGEPPTLRAIEASQLRSRKLRKGDLLIEKSGGGEKQLVGCVVSFDHEFEAVCSNFVARMPIAPELPPRFWCYVHAAIYAGRLNYPVIKQTTGIQNLDASAYLDIATVYPPPVEQRTIADFLDREGGRIDRLVAKKRELIERLKEKRTALISRTVTRGLPADAAAKAGLPVNPPLKPSGLDWLGDIPAHWGTPPLYTRYSIELGKMLNEGKIVGHALVTYLRNIDVQWDRINFEDLPEMDIEDRERDRFTLRVGDLLVCEGGEVGRAAIFSGRDGVTGYQKALHRMRPLNRREHPRFMFYTLAWASSQGIFMAEGNPNTIPHLTGEKLRRYRFPQPPPPEQAAIAAYLDRETAKLDALVAKVEAAIERLQEYRTALITAAVTGKIDVRKAAA